MKITVIGATGRVGRTIISKLADNSEDEVFAGARKPEKVPTGENISPFELDLHLSPEAITNAIPDSDVIIFVAGSGGKDLLQVDLNGAVKVMRAAEHKGIKRFIMLSSRASLDLEAFSEPDASPLTNYLIAKHYADKWLMNNTDLDYTILQPTSLTETKGSGKVTLGEFATKENSIENVAEVLIELAKNSSSIRQVIEMSDGDTPINKAIDNL
ncbi:SDR family oxidoreductase [Lentilactobacillus sp. Marseille-Q4993]|uniref:SDR family oxidoreductase n=1 Tax=Lentilactobacillus sp. Marseille-Q4993 TaxID=3039492 RepID=UPI0024BC93BE|nr:SDR family oxidoreductase [Lentilactobacillus sp. Marseille-Q4993]